MEVHPYSYFRWCGYFQGPWVSFIVTDEFSVRVTKITSRIGVWWTQQHTFKFCNLFLTQWIMAILLKGCKPYNFEPHNFLKLSFANIWDLCSNFVEFESFPWIKFFWHSCCMWGKLGWLNWFWQFLCERLSLFNPKRICYTYAWSCSLCEGSTSFAWDSLENSVDSYLFCWLALLHSMCYFFFLCWSRTS